MSLRYDNISNTVKWMLQMQRTFSKVTNRVSVPIMSRSDKAACLDSRKTTLHTVNSQIHNKAKDVRNYLFQFGLVYLFNGISTSYGLFNDKISYK